MSVDDYDFQRQLIASTFIIGIAFGMLLSTSGIVIITLMNPQLAVQTGLVLVIIAAIAAPYGYFSLPETTEEV